MTEVAKDATPTEPPEIHRADPGEQKRTLVLVLFVALSGAALILGVQQELDTIRTQVASGAAELTTARFLWLARGSFLLLALTGLVLGVLIARGALAVIREQRYPHLAARLLRDHRVVRGRKAVLYGKLGVLLAACITVAGCVGAWMGWRLLALFK